MLFYTANERLDCIQLNPAGVPYEELSCLYPWLKPIYAEWEFGFDPTSNRDYMRENPWIPIISVMLYGLLIVWGKKQMKDQQSWEWRRIMASWNLILSLFSSCGFLRLLPTVIHLLSSYPLRHTFCFDPESSYGSGSSGLWVQLFILSKFPELVDTFFLVIHNKKVIFLHWYHHITVLLYCWHSYVSSSPTGIFFATINYGVHGIMYGYYFLMIVLVPKRTNIKGGGQPNLKNNKTNNGNHDNNMNYHHHNRHGNNQKKKPRWLKSSYITIAQISQMVMGVIITILSFKFYYDDHVVVGDEGEEVEQKEGRGGRCFIKIENNLAAFLMYGSYLMLFCHFFVMRYMKKSSPTGMNGVVNTGSMAKTTKKEI